METIPLYLTTKAESEASAGALEGPPLVQWVRQHALSQGSEARYVLWPRPDGNPAFALAALAEPPTLWSIAALATQLPKARYSLETRYLGLDPEAESALQAELLLGWCLEQYRYSRYVTESRDLPELSLPPGAEAAAGEAAAWVGAITLVRDLINAPPADLGPEELAASAGTLAQQYHARCDVITGVALRRDYPAIATVGQASARPPCLIDMAWGDPEHPRVTLVGKGVCFDSGGLNLKPASGMALMKKDMGGAACVLGLARRIMEAALPLQLRVLIPAVENAVDGTAYRPSDVITMRSGRTVEVGDTDAEGRLVLADALTRACEDAPELLIDCATLTGAARVALGTELPALFCSEESKVADLLEVSHRLDDPLWLMPLHQAYASQLHSHVADTSSTGEGRYGGAITAALFLQQFVTAPTLWLHLDMMAWNLKARPGRPIGGEAMGIRALFVWLSQRYGRA